MSSPEKSSFTDPIFISSVAKRHADAEFRQKKEAEAANKQVEYIEDHYGRLLWLGHTAAEVSEAADENPKTRAKIVPLYQEQQKSKMRKFMNNRGENDLIEVAKGWDIVPSESDVVTKPPGKANLTNDSGLGLFLTKPVKDNYGNVARPGRLYSYVSRKGLKPLSDRFQKIERASIERHTFLPKEKSERYRPAMPENTFLPRYRPKTDGLPTVIGGLDNSVDNPHNLYSNPYVINQCYEALAQFVHAEDIG